MGLAIAQITSDFSTLSGGPASDVGLTLELVGNVGWLMWVLLLGWFLFHFMTLPDRSVTLRILVELLLAPGQALSTDALRRRYGVGTMINDPDPYFDACSSPTHDTVEMTGANESGTAVPGWPDLMQAAAWVHKICHVQHASRALAERELQVHEPEGVPA